jgi:hypothetical protein
MGGFGDCERRTAISQAVRETLTRTNRERVSGRLRATVAEPFRSGKRVRARITARQAPFRQERGTPCGCASLRGVDRPRPAPVKALPLCSECLSLPQRGKLFKAAMQSLKKLISIRTRLASTKVRLADVREQVIIVCAKLSAYDESIKRQKADESLVISRANSGAHTPAKEPRFPWLSSAFEAVDCCHFGRAFQPSANHYCDMVRVGIATASEVRIGGR